ncbi:MAG: ABC transporter permease [Alicyclobacillus sp.]|nr:ABC transporter permease [Alicyclobacillus sp.]
MRVILAIVRRWALSLWRSRMNLLYMVVMPVAFVFVFGVVPALGTSKVKVGVVDADHSAVSRALVRKLEQLPGTEVQVIPEADRAAALRNEQVRFAVTLPAGLEGRMLTGKPAGIVITPSPNSVGDADSFRSRLALQDALNRLIAAGTVAAESARESRTADGRAPEPLERALVRGVRQADAAASLVVADAQVVQDGLAHPDLPAGPHALAGFATMFIIFSVFGSTGQLFEERRQGTWQRMLTGPVSRLSVIAGYGLCFFLVGWIQFLILYLSGDVLFHIRMPMNGWTLLTVSLYILAVCGIALCVAGMVHTAQQHAAVGTMVAVATSMLGGAYWPVDLEPVWMQHLAWFVPQHWALQALSAIVLGGPSASALPWALTALAAFAAVFFSAGMIQLRFTCARDAR